MPDHDYVPLMFQAQVRGRSQIQKLEDLRRIARETQVSEETLQQQAYLWARQWQEACDDQTVPKFDRHVQTRAYKFPWRMVTNSGQDVGVIRPVMGERGWAYFPGSSMKGAFLRACKRLCSSEQVQRFCGADFQGEMVPGILRFHGGYPKDAEWLDDSLVDVVHPQESWQLNGERNNGAFIQISLYQPTFTFGISSTETLTEAEWGTVWQVWQAAIEQGIGSRVSAGYGQIAEHKGNRLLKVKLSGQGACSRRIDKEGEFRPNMIKAALRGHTRRLFHGITDEQSAIAMTKLLWGGIGKGEEAVTGLLGIGFNAPDLEMDEWVGNNRNNRVPVYETGDATLEILLMQPDLSDEQKRELEKLAKRLVQFSLLLGGFGKSWRRADHRLFMPKYRNQMIGCHWEFLPPTQNYYVPPGKDLAGVTKFLDAFYQTGQSFSWLKSTGKPAANNIREAWCKGNVQIWGRLAEDVEDSLAIDWLHGHYAQGKRIKETDLTGKMGQIGRLWHRMYPRFIMKKDEQGKQTWKPTDQYVELLTIFPHVDRPDQKQIVQDFQKFLVDSSDFKQLW